MDHDGNRKGQQYPVNQEIGRDGKYPRNRNGGVLTWNHMIQGVLK